MSQSLHEQFSFFLPAELTKGKDENGVEEMKISGVASSATSDSDGETLLPSGFDHSPFMTKGFLNWDHQAKKTPSAVVGEPTKCSVINNGKDFHIEGRLYNDSPEAVSIYKLGKVLEKNSKSRRLGFSIEGQVLERKSNDPNDPGYKIITKATITGVAITPCPKNPNTLMQIVKGESDHMLMEREYDEDVVKKAMEVDQTLANHDIHPEKKASDKCPKCKKEKCECEAVGSYLKKSEIYNLIANRYTTDVIKAKQIFSFIQDVNKKLFNMSEKTISNEAIEKAFAFLDSASIVKSKSEDEDEINSPAGEAPKGKEKDIPEDDAPADKDDEVGDDDDEEGPSDEEIKKAEEAADEDDDEDDKEVEKSVTNEIGSDTINNLILKSINDQTAIIKSLTETNNDRFGALGTILKATRDQNEILKSQIDTLTSRLGKVESVKIPSKSVKGIAAVEKFEKSQENEIGQDANTFNLNKGEDVAALSTRMFNYAYAERSAGSPNRMLEKAVGDLEIAKSVGADAIGYLQAKGIKVVRN